MNSIIQAIVALLYDHDVVTVPGLGAFVRHNEGAHVNVITNEFERPTSSLSFDPQQREENSLIADYLVSHGNVTEEEAKQQIAVFVSECYAKLMGGDTLNFPEVGDLHYNEQQEIVFESLASNNFNGDAFGLSDIHPNPIFTAEAGQDWKEQVARQNKDKNTRMTVGIDDDNRRKTWWIWLLLVLLVAAVALWYFMREPENPEPVVMPDSADTVMAKDTSSHPLDTIITSDTLQIQIDSLKNDGDSLVKPAVDTVKEPVNPFKAIDPPEEAKAIIVGGCFSVEENAANMVSAAMEQGYADAFVMKRGRMFYVCYGQFVTVADAKAVLPEVRSAYNNKAWILTK